MTPAGSCRAACDSRSARDPAVTFLLVLAVFRFQPGRRQRGGKHPAVTDAALRHRLYGERRPASAICTAWSGLLQGPDSASGVHPFAVLILPAGKTALSVVVSPHAVSQMILFVRRILSRWPSSQFSNFYKGRRRSYAAAPGRSGHAVRSPDFAPVGRCCPGLGLFQVCRRRRPGIRFRTHSLLRLGDVWPPALQRVESLDTCQIRRIQFAADRVPA